MRINYPSDQAGAIPKKRPRSSKWKGWPGIFIIQGDGVKKKVISILIGDSPEFE